VFSTPASPERLKAQPAFLYSVVGLADRPSTVGHGPQVCPVASIVCKLIAVVHLSHSLMGPS